ncbi:hypothetical protein AJ88_29325 [Mesorhizobium amorphae CCBAU 01583]|nr:hypothetical protein AJ88_29325 [Mesorhizobium amorphae CCBAU 01583]
MIMARERLFLFDTTLRMASRRRALIFPSRTRSPSQSCSTNSASTMSRAAILAPTPPTPLSSSRSARQAPNLSPSA